MEYKDNHGEYYYKFSKLGTYEELIISPRGSDNREIRRGLYIYKQTGKRTGEFVLDMKDKWNVKFISPTRAQAKKDGDSRTSILDFEWAE
jgi:hypothetical protein